MDKAQSFIKECLFTKNFDNPNKPIDEQRLQQTLLLMPTDGGLSTRLKRYKSSTKLTATNIEGNSNNHKHPNYRTVNKNSKSALRNYINNCKDASKRAKNIAKENKINNRSDLNKLLREKYKDLFDKLPRYETFLPMYEDFWVEYIKDILSLSSTVESGSRPSINANTSLMKLSMADYNGSLLKIVKSKNRNMTGIEGIVIWDSQKSFIMVTEGDLIDDVKCIPKKGTIFSFEIPINEEEALQYSILGDRFKYRSVDRASRKFKARRCDDMLYQLHGEFI
ncbi:similar to Saccharomyces cerevisiae YBR257W POP4 Subunit of both RNase MRP and nuclear RNase P [Maudiozyma barnettii]|uniref:Ribonuclease P protein subunit n=1 Tax=Maudiozyma barnettii TaxID=61262 RepID=A0A8H2ZIQ0_9SACH|nr:RNase P/RNase MRP complex subunit [Kazachstania barnettii]CAB4253269.1 similar to Saccharomyces cerevisiae YBR257W POP4 Subunit of both RNase MRP and nuclear RNase P [Kazachstania barnettii]CAD1780195.1 similar to Saccharomyces cerevisiae YBR257W POP4 Subunit of both RNase MRP and nuclear RNase P [Kazachstania barnettii]